jgi:hypothetical protein
MEWVEMLLLAANSSTRNGVLFAQWLLGVDQVV